MESSPPLSDLGNQLRAATLEARRASIERDRLIVELRARKVKIKDIAHMADMTYSGVIHVVQRLGYVCPRCGAMSHHPEDAAERYCARCHQFEERPPKP